MTDDGGRIPAQYQHFVEVVSKVKAKTHPPHRPTDHAIDLEPGYKQPYGRIYNLSEFALKTLKAYIETNLASGFIQRSSSLAAAPMLFEKKKDGGLRLCVDHRALNLGTGKMDSRSRESQNYLIECAKPESSLSWTSGMPTTSSESTKQTNSRLHSEPAMVSSNTKLCPSHGHTHRLRSRLTLTIVYGPILTTSPCVTLTIYSSTRPMRRSTKTKSEKCCNTYRNLCYIARPKSANSEFENSVFTDLASIRMGSAWSPTAYPRLKIGRPRNQFRMCKCSSASQTSTGDSFGNMQR